MCGFPVYSNGQRTISLWFDNSVQEGDGAILLVVLYCKPYGRVNTVYVLKEALFVGFLVDDKGVIYIPAPELGGVGAVLRAFCSKYSMYRLATMGLTGEPMATPYVNNPSLNNNIGKFNLSHIWDRVLLNTKGLTLK